MEDSTSLLCLGVDAGPGVRVSRLASIHGAARLSVGEMSRIDDFCVISAGRDPFRIGAHVHIGTHAVLIGRGALTIDDFANLSGRVSIYTSSDDYSGATMTNPTIPEAYTNVTHAPVHVGRHAIIGAASVVLPGVTIGEGAAVGALSLVNRNVAPFTIVAGVPARVVGERSRALLDVERLFLAQASRDGE